MRDVILVAHIHDGGNGVVHIFLNAVVDAAAADCRARAVVINAQSAADIHEINIVAQGS
jgi:hypothetical protein